MENVSEQTIYIKLQRFADITKFFIEQGNIRRAKRCINRADVLFSTGNMQVKNAIANIYVFSVSSFMEMHHCSIRNLFPESLINLYHEQVNASGT